MNREPRSLLLEEVRTYNPDSLRSVDTRVTRYGGTQEVENKSLNGSFIPRANKRELAPRKQWYAPDYRPDLQVAQILPGLLLGMLKVNANIFCLVTKFYFIIIYIKNTIYNLRTY